MIVNTAKFEAIFHVKATGEKIPVLRFQRNAVKAPFFTPVNCCIHKHGSNTVPAVSFIYCHIINECVVIPSFAYAQTTYAVLI